MDILEKLEFFLKEDNPQVQIIKENCQQFLSEVREPLWHGTNGSLPFENKLRVRSAPKNMPLVLHQAIDQAFNSIFGFKARTHALFCTGDKSQANSYGKPYAIFPKDGFKFVWSDKVKDLYLKFVETSISSASNDALKHLLIFFVANDFENIVGDSSLWNGVPKDVQKIYPTAKDALDGIEPNLVKYSTEFVKRFYEPWSLNFAISKKHEIMLHAPVFYATSDPKIISAVFS